MRNLVHKLNLVFVSVIMFVAYGFFSISSALYWTHMAIKKVRVRSRNSYWKEHGVSYRLEDLNSPY